jgi:hypothetical protein
MLLPCVFVSQGVYFRPHPHSDAAHTWQCMWGCVYFSPHPHSDATPVCLRVLECCGWIYTLYCGTSTEILAFWLSTWFYLTTCIVVHGTSSSNSRLLGKYMYSDKTMYSRQTLESEYIVQNHTYKSEYKMYSYLRSFVIIKISKPKTKSKLND